MRFLARLAQADLGLAADRLFALIFFVAAATISILRSCDWQISGVVILVDPVTDLSFAFGELVRDHDLRTALSD